MIYQKLLYTTGIEIGKELAIARWMERDTNIRNNGFIYSAIRKWDEGKESDSKAFIQEYILIKWFEYTKFDKKEQITRRKRIEYILKSLSDIKIINFFCKNVIDIFNILNKPKHTFKYTNEKNLESLFYMIEGIALFLIYCKS